MICLKCNSENYTVMMSESFQCSHCDGYIFLEYCTCDNCGAMWRAIDGEIDEKNIVTPDDLVNMITPLGGMITMDPADSPLIDEDFVKRLEEELLKHENKENAASMADLVHRCMRCQALAYESKPGNYECSECGFSWEVLDFGE